MRNKLSSLKNRVSTIEHHIFRYRGRYGVTAGAVAAVVVLNKVDRVSEWNEFLIEKDLFDEFYHPGE